MASAIIHLAVAKKIKESLYIPDTYDYYLGSIAPDISKQIGKTKEISHFLTYNNSIPNIEAFTNKYPNFKYNSFDLGYFIHLYTDKIWFEEFITNIVYNDSIKLLDGTIIKIKDEEELLDLVYSDYTNINIKIIEEYDFNLSMFYEEFKIPKTKISEIPIEQLDILINKMGIIIENSKKKKAYLFDIISIKNFVDEVSEKILDELKKY